MLQIENLIGLNGNPVVNQFVVKNNLYIYFRSYDSLIARKNRKTGEVVVSPNWCYSKTTSKYFYKWLRDYTHCSATNSKEMRKLIKQGVIKVSLSAH